MTSWDTIVVGLGAMGAATLYQLAKRGQRVLGIDRFTPPHVHGSTHGETRLTRCAIGEGENYVPFALRSHEIWRDVEQATGTSLLVQSGVLILSDPASKAAYHGKSDFVGRTIAAARRFAIPHEVMDASAVARRFPQFKLGGTEVGYYEPGAGFVYPERCVQAQLDLARGLGADIRCNTRIAAIGRDGPDAASVTTSAGETFLAARVVIAAGAWTAGLVGGECRTHLTVTRQVFDWFAADDPLQYGHEVFPTFIWMHGCAPTDSMYGFPIAPGGVGMKIGTEQFVDITGDPDAVPREVTVAETERMYSTHIATRLRGVRSTALRSTTCLYTFTPDGDFLIDHAEGNDRVLVMSPCSGHGFKHSAALGETVARQVIEDSPVADLLPFSAGRLGRAAAPATAPR